MYGEIHRNINRGYSNVFVKYVFYVMSEVDNIYINIVHLTSEIKDVFNKKHLKFLFIIYKKQQQKIQEYLNKNICVGVE